MEPCLFRHGKRGPRPGASTCYTRLQWSHVFSDMVRSSIAPGGGKHTAALQWSHVFSDMVRGSGSPGISTSPTASMEPCLFRHGKHLEPGYDAMLVLPLQWSHVFSDMVSPAWHRVSYLLSRLQWSHVFSDMVRWMPGRRLPRPPGFNGAMSFQTW